MEEYSYTSILLWVRVACYRVKHYLNLPNFYNLTSTPLTVHKGLYAFIIYVFSSTWN